MLGAERLSFGARPEEMRMRPHLPVALAVERVDGARADSGRFDHVPLLAGRFALPERIRPNANLDLPDPRLIADFVEVVPNLMHDSPAVARLAVALLGRAV